MINIFLGHKEVNEFPHSSFWLPARCMIRHLHVLSDSSFSDPVKLSATELGLLSPIQGPKMTSCALSEKKRREQKLLL